ncbi:MAG: hypothetical protein PVG75_09830 [Thioalkalispiraceae bacterium]|jgi:hypothetical protein
MRHLLSLLALSACLSIVSVPVSIAEDADAAKIKELKAKCSKGDQHACTELEFLSD